LGLIISQNQDVRFRKAQMIFLILCQNYSKPYFNGLKIVFEFQTLCLSQKIYKKNIFINRNKDFAKLDKE
jgi:hypothetical protein